jgi:hypothetical protein
MENSLLRDSTFQKRSLLESVRSYLDQQGKNVSILPPKPQAPTTVLDSPPRCSGKSGGFGKKFRNLLQSQPKEDNSILMKRKCRPPSSDHLDSNRIRPAPKEKRTRISVNHSPPRARPLPPSQGSTISHTHKNFSSKVVEGSTISQPPASSVGFASSNWRDRMQAIFAKGAQSPSLSAISADSDRKFDADSGPSPNLPSTSSIEIISADVVNQTPTAPSRRNLVPAKSEVSLNFVRKDLKSRGSYKFKSGKNARRARSRDFRQGREGAPFNSDTIQIDNPDGTMGAPKERRSSGLSVFGLDPFHLYLQSSSQKKKEVTDSEISPPLCPGHQMAAKLLTVKKAGLNKVMLSPSSSLPISSSPLYLIF